MRRIIGSVVRIRIPGSDQKQDIYRLVQVVGTSKVAEPYKIGTRMTNVMLEIINLDKKELISIDGISNQEFSEDECRRLRQCIKCGLSKRLSVGEIQEKVVTLQAVRVIDVLEAEILRLSHLRDRASEKGHRKEYPFRLLKSSLPPSCSALKC
ncbi:Zinc finger ccch domain-containing protein 19 [Quillaja saponaria]|uniref:Zinc finger ccch domain-containing protein 19 n=1 Tax=Quillaja saponaria TaxID=32244 RepID=A0AAD7L974_QUISA|nr:Zinc finger ccch domain-containing protein 19 [Quillaja saponaria]